MDIWHAVMDLVVSRNVGLETGLFHFAANAAESRPSRSRSKSRLRNRALFDLAIDSKLRGCDLLKIKISDIVSDQKFGPEPLS